MQLHECCAHSHGDAHNRPWGQTTVSAQEAAPNALVGIHT